jgi:hypothetical protein
MRLTALFGFGWIGLDWIGSRWALYRLTQALSTEAYASSRFTPRPALLTAAFLTAFLRSFFHFTHLLPFQIVQPVLSLLNPFCLTKIVPSR